MTDQNPLHATKYKTAAIVHIILHHNNAAGVCSSYIHPDAAVRMTIHTNNSSNLNYCFMGVQMFGLQRGIQRYIFQ